MRKRHIFMVVALLCVMLAACKEDYVPDIPGLDQRPYPQSFPISISDQDGNDILGTEDVVVSINYKGKDYEVGEGTTPIGINSRVYIDYREHVENNLYKPRHDLIIEFEYEDYDTWDEDLIFYIDVLGERHTMEKGDDGYYRINGEIEKSAEIFFEYRSPYYHLVINR